MNPIITIAIALALASCGPEPVRDAPFDYDRDDYAQGISLIDV